jgi:hypothetical protein
LRGDGSGAVALAFTAANRMPHDDQDLMEHRVLAEGRIDLFQAAADPTHGR